MSLDVASPKEILDAFEEATATFNLCPNRVWAVARQDLPRLIPAAKGIQVLDDHKQCTIDFCEHSQRDFTAVEQRHECEDERWCRQHTFQQKTLVAAATKGSSTVWALDGTRLLASHRPYMAISHVWSDGTGTGSWPAGRVNKCLHAFFREMAETLGCEGIWWDTISIPKEKAARTTAIRRIQSSYQAARLTLVHDCFLRNSQWVDAEAACFAILMSPWFSRGWTALELASSGKVKVLFKGHHGSLVKDLDEEILAKDENASEAHKRATDLIKTLRRRITTLDDLLIVLGSRFTSWPKDMAVISGLLVGVDVVAQKREHIRWADLNQKGDILQQDIYKRVLTKIGRVAAGHLFHNSATIGKGSSWCPINLFSIPISGQDHSLKVEDDLDLVGMWDIIPVSDAIEQHCIWNGTHLLLKMQLQLALQDVNRCVLLTECGIRTVDRALLVKLKCQEAMEGRLCFQYVGALHFHPGLQKEEYTKIEVVIFGDASSRMVNDQENAWQRVKEMGNVERTRPQAPKTKAFLQIEDETIMALWPDGDRTVREPGTERTALHYAVMRGDHIAFQELLKISDVGAQDRLGQLPLHLAAERGHAQILYDLLDEICDRCGSNFGRRTAILNAPCKSGQTTLHLAVFACSEVIVDRLLKVGVDPNLMDKNKNTALHIAVKNGCEPVIGQLLEARANPNLKDKNGNTALHMAVESGSEPVIGRLLEANGDPNLMNIDDHTALHIAIKYKFKPAIMRLLSGTQCDINMAKPSSFTPLYYAVDYGREQMVRLLLENGADVNKACGSNNEVPLRQAIAKGYPDIVECLISNGANPNAKDIERVSLLHVAVQKRDKVTMSLLLNAGASVDVRDKSKLTPLHYAARQGSKSSVELLLKNGASVNAKGWRGSTPWDFARRMKHSQVADLLRARR